MFLICFDVCDEKRLRQVARQMENFGVRVQKSVFECHLNEAELADLQKRLAGLIDETEDTIRYYGLCHKDSKGILIDGVGQVTPEVNFVFI